MFKGLQVEIGVVALLAATVGALAFQDRLLKQTTLIDGDSIGRYVVYGYGDDTMGGASRPITDASRPLSWACELKESYQYPFCGYEILFDAAGHREGLDLSNIERIVLRFAYDGDAAMLRMHLKNHDPAYSVAGKPETNKFNRIDFPVRRGVQTIELSASDFGVAEWWLTENNVPPELSRPQFDNIISFDLQTGPGAKPGLHRLSLESAAFEGTLLTKSQFYGGILAAWLVLVGGFVLARIWHLSGALREKSRLHEQSVLDAEQVREAARRDHLTGILNRMGVTELFEQALSYPSGCRSVSIILVDVDNFKTINDYHGHGYGDDVLASIAQVLKRNVRAGDLVGRWGGEEFIVICFDTDEATTAGIAEKLRRRIEHFHFGDCERVTASFGTYWCDTGFSDLAPLVACADIALYAAKTRGRNRAVRYNSMMKAAA